MKTITSILLTAGVVILFIYGCKKENTIQEPSVQEKPTYQSRGAFPTSIFLGNDASYSRTDSVCLTDYTAYLATCVINPQSQTLQTGVEIYQISGPSMATIGWTVYNFKQVPTLTNLKPGTYSIAGRAYVIGYNVCDSAYVNEIARDTINIKILKSRKK